jgi:hypothetical protein
MRRPNLSLFRLLPLVLACGGLGLPAARAEPPSNVTFSAPGLLGKKEGPSGPPSVRAQPQAWPRLDPGAVLCRTEDDLTRLAANRSGGQGGGPVDCRVITHPTPVTIIQRQGPGRTEVQVSPPGSGNGWTDVWLPAKAPGTVAQ